MKNPFLKKAKNIVGRLHLWLGLASGLIVFIICLTGTILAFEKQLEDWFNRKVAYVAEPGEEKLPLEDILAAYEAEFGQPVNRIKVFENPRRSVYVRGTDPESDERIEAYFNPYTGEFSGTTNKAAATFFSQTMRLHRWLLARPVGRTIVGVATTIFLFMLISGLILWWPKRLSKLKNNLTISRKAPWKVVNYQLHNVLGFYSLLFLFVMAFTGLYIGQKWFRNGVNIVIESNASTAARDGSSQDKTGKLGKTKNQNKEPSGQPKAQTTAGAGEIAVRPVPKPQVVNFEMLVKRANQQLPYSSDLQISMPSKRNKNISITKYKNQMGARLSERVDMHPKTGEVVEVATFDKRDATQKYRYINRFLHTGEIMGWPLQLLFFIACVFGTSLPITGTIIWINKMKR